MLRNFGPAIAMALSRMARAVLPALALAAISACGGGGGTPPTYSIGGTVSGIDAGQSVVLQDNGGERLTVSANGAFAFATKIASGGAYAVTVTAPEGKTCTVTGGSGTVSANVNDVAVACVSNVPLSIGGTVSGLGVGQSVVLLDNGVDNLTVSANGAFTFATKVSSGGPYQVKVGTQPQGEYCAVAGGSGTASADVSSVAVACAGPYTVGGTVSGLVGQGLELVLGPMHLAISGNGKYTFPAAVDAGPSGETVSIAQQPQSPAQSCIVQNQYFTSTPPYVTDISDVNVVCGEFLYMTNSGADSISAYSIDATIGAISLVGRLVTAGRSPAAMAGTIDKKYLYISNSRTNDVSAFAVDAGSGALTPFPGSPFAAGTDPSAVAMFTSTECTVRGGHCSLLENLYVANSGSDTISAYQVDPNTGIPTPLPAAPYAPGTGPSAMAVGPGAPFTPFLYVAHTGGSNDISAFQVGGFPGLSSVVGSPFPSNGNVSSLAFGAGDAFVYPPGTSGGTAGIKGLLYAANASGAAASITGFSIHPYMGDANDGALTSLSGFPYDLPSCNYIVADQTGAYLYATAGTNVFGFSIDKKTGALSPLPGSPVAVGATADSAIIDPANQFLYVISRSAGKVTGFILNGETGALTPMPGSPFAVGESVDFVQVE